MPTLKKSPLTLKSTAQAKTLLLKSSKAKKIDSKKSKPLTKLLNKKVLAKSSSKKSTKPVKKSVKSSSKSSFAGISSTAPKKSSKPPFNTRLTQKTLSSKSVKVSVKAASHKEKPISIKVTSTENKKNDRKEIISLAKQTKDSNLANPKIIKADRTLRTGQGTVKKFVKMQGSAPFPKKVREVSQGTTTHSIMKNTEPSEQTKQIVLNARKRVATPSFFKKRPKSTPIVFTLEDVRKIVKEHTQQSTAEDKASSKNNTISPAHRTPKSTKLSSKTQIPPQLSKQTEPARSLGAASILDILGFNPKEKNTIPSFTDVSDRIPKKFMKYYNLLVELRKHVLQELNLHTEQTLKISSKDDSGNISSYSQHIADEGTDTFDRDFALSLVSSEQEALNEIEDAIQRMLEGSYGICEITGEKIAPERLDAVPFTRFSLEGQIQFEKTHKRPIQRGGVFSETTVAEATHFVEEDV